jgi:glycosyltransferase involved in cell wall biosynthesis
MTGASAEQGNGRVQVAYLHPHKVSHSWHESMMRLVAYDAANSGRVVETGGPFMISCDSGGLVEARNTGVKRFLDETDHEWFFWIDTDMGFMPDTVDRLLDAADAQERPVVGALCFGLREVAYDGYGGRRMLPTPTIYMPATSKDGITGFAVQYEYPDDTLLQVGATGAACILMHRTALEKVRAQYGERWYDRVRYDDGMMISEDLSFCARLAMLSLPVFVHTGVKTTHHKQVWVSDLDYSPPAFKRADAATPAEKPADTLEEGT